MSEPSLVYILQDRLSFAESDHVAWTMASDWSAWILVRLVYHHKPCRGKHYEQKTTLLKTTLIFLNFIKIFGLRPWAGDRAVRSV